MQTNCCHVSFAFVLKLLNSLQAFVGVSMVLYSIWMLDQWNHHVPISPPPLAPSPDSSVSDSILFNSGPEIGAQSARVFDGLAVGLVSGLDDSVGLNLSSVEPPAPWFIYSFMGIGILLCCITLIGCIAAESVNGCCLCFFQYTLLKIVLILIEAALVAFIAIDRRWEKDLPFDPTGELDSFRSFVEENIDICKWVGLGVVIIQALALLVAIILRAMVSAGRRDIEEEDDYESVRGRTWEPLLNPQSSYSSTSAKGDGRGTQSNMWGSRIREKFGLQSGDKYNSLK